MLSEKYRPKTLDDMIGNEKVIRRVKFMIERNTITGKILWIVGPSGSGKTTLARILSEMYCEYYATDEIDAQDVGITYVRDAEERCRTRSISAKKPLHGYIVNEAHGLSSKIIPRLLTTFDDPMVQKNSVWFFTTTTDGNKKLFENQIDTGPFLSRTTVLELNNSGLAGDFAKKLHEIAVAEDAGPDDFSVYMKMLIDCKGNMRDALNRIESGELLEDMLSN